MEQLRGHYRENKTNYRYLLMLCAFWVLLSAISLMLLLSGISGCSQGPNVNKLSELQKPKDILTYAMLIYNKEYDDYLARIEYYKNHQERVTPAIREASKQKKEALTQLHDAITIYRRYVETGSLPPREVDRALRAAIEAVL